MMTFDDNALGAIVECERTIDNPLWIDGTVNQSEYDFQAKVYDEPSEYGIDGGRVSKLFVKRSEDDGWADPVISYDRAWDIQPEDDQMWDLFDAIVSALEQMPLIG